jgi:hypothetical protein
MWKMQGHFSTEELRRANIHHIRLAAVDNLLCRLKRPLLVAPPGAKPELCGEKCGPSNNFSAGMPGSRAPLPSRLGVSTRRTGDGL